MSLSCSSELADIIWLLLYLTKAYRNNVMVCNKPLSYSAVYLLFCEKIITNKKLEKEILVNKF